MEFLSRRVQTGPIVTLDEKGLLASIAALGDVMGCIWNNDTEQFGQGTEFLGQS